LFYSTIATTTQSTEPMTDQSALQRDLLVAIRDDPGASGRALGLQLEQHYENITNPTLYQTLSELVTAGLVDKTSTDERSNAYELTDDGRDALNKVAGARANQHKGPNYSDCWLVC